MKKSSSISTIILIFQFVTIACLVISFVTVPLFKFTSNKKSSTSNLLSLSEHRGIQYGVFGYCETAKKECRTPSANYKAYEIQQKYKKHESDWKLGLNARKTLSELLIVVPVAAGLVFLNLIGSSLNIITKSRDINENERFIFVQFIVSIIISFLAFAASAMSCIVVFLLFYPHINWPAWVLIPAAVLSLVCLPLSFFQYLSKKGEVYNLETGAIIEEKQNDLYGNTRLLSDDVVFEEDKQSLDYFNNNDGHVSDESKSKNFFTELKKLNTNNMNSSSDFDNKASLNNSESYAQPSRLVDVMNNGGSKNTSTSNLSSHYGNKKDSFNMYQEYKQNESEGFSNANSHPAKYDSAALSGNPYRDASDSSSYYATANSYAAQKLPGSNLERENTFKTNDFKPESILLLDKKSPLENINGMSHKGSNLPATTEEEVANYSDISDSDKDFVRKNIIPKSQRPDLDSDDGLHDDQGSNFTSVSQRAGNPQYIQKKFNAQPTSNMNNYQGNTYQKQQVMPQQQQMRAYPQQYNQNNYYQQQQRSGPMGGYAGQPPAQYQQYNGGQMNRVGINHQALNPQQRTRAPMVFQNNADFNAPIGSSYQQQQYQGKSAMQSKFQPPVYKPGYKKKPMGANNMMGPASLSNPYANGSGQQPYSGFR